MYGDNAEMDEGSFNQHKYSRTAKSRRTVICRISVNQNPNFDENQPEINTDEINGDHELTKLKICSPKNNETPTTETYL